MSTKQPTRGGNYKRSRGNPTGRVDMLCMNLLTALVRQRCPEFTPLLEANRRAIQAELTRRIGPRTKRGKTVRDFVRAMSAQKQEPRGVTGHTFVKGVPPK